MLKKITLFFCALLCSSFSLAMEGNNSSLALSNQAGVPVKVGGYTTYGGAVVGNLKQNSTPQKSIKKPVDYYPSSMEFLQKAADKELWMRSVQAQKISDQINEQYIGTGGNWSLIRQFTAWTRFQGPSYGYGNINDAVKDLAEINAHAKVIFDRPLIDELRAKSHRFNELVTILVREKARQYGLISACGNDVIRGSTIDNFLDAQCMFPGLPTALQEYIQLKIEDIYRRDFRLKECAPFVPHVLRTAIYNSKENEQELKALLKSSTLKRLDCDTKFSFISWINGILAKPLVDKQCQCDDTRVDWFEGFDLWCTDCYKYENFRLH